MDQEFGAIIVTARQLQPPAVTADQLGCNRKAKTNAAKAQPQAKKVAGPKKKSKR